MVDLRSGPPLALLVEAGRSAGGLVTTSQASGLGIDRKTLQRLVARGALIREAHGVYRLVGARVGLADRALAATTRIGGVVSHQTASQLWGFRGPGFDDQAIHLTVRHGSHPTRMKDVIVHQSRRPMKGFTTKRDGVEVTRPLRTVLDVSGQAIEDEQLRRFLDFCIAERLLTIRSLERFLASKGRYVPGIARLRRSVESLCGLDSVAEAELLGILVDAGIERPITQFAIRIGGRFVGRVDLAWPALQVALELDGYRYHSDAQTFVSDRERGNRIVAAGWALLRTTPATVRRFPHMVVADVKAALGRSTAA
jgi:hypothetical protein